MGSSTPSAELPFVSVIIAAYNAVGFIERSVKSAIGQEGVLIEVIVIDDCSTDDTCSLVDTITENDKRVRLIRMERNQGPAGARNAGLDHARGDWVAVLDADDKFLPGRLQTLLKLAQLQKFEIVADNFFFHDTNGVEPDSLALRTEPDVDQICLERFIWGASGETQEADLGLLKPILSRSFVEKHQLRYDPSIRHGEDFQFLLRALDLGGRLGVLRSNALYLYSLRSSGWSRTIVDYRATRTRALEAARSANENGQDSLAKLYYKIADNCLRLHLDYLGSLPSEIRPRLPMIANALAAPAGRRWLFSRLKRRFGR